MRLWLWYVPGTDEQIQQAANAASAVLQARGISVEVAFAATLAANEVDETASEVTHNVSAVSAWYAAEFAAFQAISDLTNEWPAQGSLIVLEE